MSLVNVIFSESPAALAEALKPYPAVFVVADRKIGRYITEPLVEHLAESGVALRGVLELKMSERRKTFRTVEKITKWLIGAGADRDALVLAVGGGITSDLAGFAACTYKRGVRYANVPTTLLAQVDASIGGKTGCNVGAMKNMAGIIKQPEFTYINPTYIKTLSWDHFSAGYAELLKTFIIGDPTAYEDAVNLQDYSKIAPLISAAVQIKKDIVERDQFEKNERRLLNLGHTFAHAIEYKSSKSLLHGRISHGHAVAIGIIMAAQRSEQTGLAKPGLAKRLIRDFEAVGLPTSCPWSEDELAEVIRTDKKAKDGVVHYVLMREVGDVVIC